MSELKEAAAQMKEWLAGMSDESKADVLKVQIAEQEKTKRAVIEHGNVTERHLHDTEGYHLVRAMFVVFLFSVVAFATCVGYKRLEIEEARVRATAPAASAVSKEK